MTLTHSELCSLAVKWIRSKKESNCYQDTQRCNVIARELRSCNVEIPDVIGFGPSGHTILIECKSSISDYKRNFDKVTMLLGGMGDYRYFFTESGLLTDVKELPPAYGLIETDGRHFDVVKRPTFLASNKMAEQRLLLSMIRNPNRNGIWLK